MSEKFVLAENKGFIGYLGFTTDVSLFGANAISTEIYNQLDVVNLSVGEIIKNSIDNLQNSNGNIVLETAIHALVLHGDPTYKINKGTSFDISVDSIEQPIDNNTLLNDNIKEENIPSNPVIEPKISNYPNPVSDNTTFEVTLDESFVNINIQIFDIKGQLGPASIRVKATYKANRALDRKWGNLILRRPKLGRCEDSIKQPR